MFSELHLAQCIQRSQEEDLPAAQAREVRVQHHFICRPAMLGGDWQPIHTIMGAEGEGGGQGDPNKPLLSP